MPNDHVDDLAARADSGFAALSKLAKLFQASLAQSNNLTPPKGTWLSVSGGVVAGER